MVDELAGTLMRLTAAAFAGICLYIAAVQHPVRTASTPDRALDDFRAVIPRAEKVQAPLLVLCLVAAGVFLLRSFTWSSAIGAALMLGVLVQTVVAVLPINRELLSGAAGDHLEASPSALARWGSLHALRTVAACVGAALLCW